MGCDSQQACARCWAPGSGLQALASSPAEAAAQAGTTTVGQISRAVCIHDTGSAFTCSRMHAANIFSGILNDGFKSFSVEDHLHS